MTERLEKVFYKRSQNIPESLQINIHITFKEHNSNVLQRMFCEHWQNV